MTKPEPSAADPLDLSTLPRALDVKTTARLWNCSPDALYDMIARGECPVPVLRIGKLIRLPRAAVLTVIGCSEADDS